MHVSRRKVRDSMDALKRRARTGWGNRLESVSLRSRLAATRSRALLATRGEGFNPNHRVNRFNCFAPIAGARS